MSGMNRGSLAFVAACLLPWVSESAIDTSVCGAQETGTAQESATQEKTIEVLLAEGRLEFQATEIWEKKKPRFNIVEAEFEAKPAKGEGTGARLTIMASGGSIDQNLERWFGQFSQEDGSYTADKSKQKEEKINGMTVHLVDIAGTYADSPGPFAGNPTMRKNYRMLGAIVETKIAGNYYFKMYGPADVMQEHEKRFMAMVKSIKMSL